jgi:hypothetical protein
MESSTFEHKTFILHVLQLLLESSHGLLMTFALVLESKFVRPIPTFQFVDLLFQTIVFLSETRQCCELLVPFVLDPRNRSFATFTVVYLMNSSQHGQFVVYFVRMQPVFRV